MKLTRSLSAVALSFSLAFIAFIVLPIQSVSAQDSTIALQRGFRTGYSDGYMAGYRDSIDNAAKDFSHHSDYSKANRAYNKEYGTLEDYSDGYRQGFESGYGTGFEKQSFDAKIPVNLVKRGNMPIGIGTSVPAPAVPQVQQHDLAPSAAAATPGVSDSTAATETAAAPTATSESFQKASFMPVSDAVIIIPRDTELIVELTDPLSTETSREGDKFTAKVVSPAEITGAIIEGHVNKITKPGRIKRRSELQLSFDRIILNEDRWSNFNALLVEALPVKGDNIKRVDNEGMAVGNRSYKQDGLKIGAATGTGIVIGAFAGGPVGAAVGAGVGAAFGVGAVLIERGKHVNLARSQQFRVRTSYETQIK